MELDNELNQKLGMQQGLMQGGFNMPGMDLGGRPQWIQTVCRVGVS